jgi:signal transduction histidine kinase
MPEKNDAVRLYSDIIQRNANRIEELISEMLNSSRPKELNLELHPLDEIVEETLALATDRMNLNQIKLEKDIKSGLPRLLADKEKLKIALLNIVINAVEAMQPAKGILKIEVTSSDGYNVVCIADNGKGIAPEDVEKLFDPFYTSKEGGMGLGLTSTKNILNSHGATVDVKSKPHEGTTFFIYFKLS